MKQLFAEGASEPADPATGPIGVFDSGIGGLTVVAELQRLLPAEQIFYIGDTARVPYGGKSRRTIERTAWKSRDCCSRSRRRSSSSRATQLALAVPRLKQIINLPVQGVIDPGAAAAVRATRNGRIGVIATRATIASRAYEQAIHELAPETRVFAEACPLLVPLIEEALFDDSITDQVLHRYLDPLLAKASTRWFSAARITAALRGHWARGGRGRDARELGQKLRAGGGGNPRREWTGRAGASARWAPGRAHGCDGGIPARGRGGAGT